MIICTQWQKIRSRNCISAKTWWIKKKKRHPSLLMPKISVFPYNQGSKKSFYSRPFTLILTSECWFPFWAMFVFFLCHILDYWPAPSFHISTQFIWYIFAPFLISKTRFYWIFLDFLEYIPSCKLKDRVKSWTGLHAIICFFYIFRIVQC